MAGRRTHPMTEQRLAFHRNRCQARFRKEDWDPQFTFDQWWQLWHDHWKDRGLGKYQRVMLRLDHDLAWSKDNVVVCERWEYLCPHGQYWRGGRRANQ